MPYFSFKQAKFTSDTKHLLIPVLFVILLFSCRKEENNPGGTTVVQGGKVTLTAQVKHHSFPVGGCEVYLKYNTSEFPGKDVSQYDLHKTAGPNGFVQFEALPNGDHYLYARGWDAAVSDSVTGYIPVSVYAKPGEEKEFDYEIPVSE
jgi:hypothetical protein